MNNTNSLLVKDIPYNVFKIPKPILKWVGGKTQILDKVIGLFPTKICNYRESFVGGGSVLLALLSYAKNGVITITGNIYAYDLNAPLIFLYKNIQTNHNDLYNKLQELIKEYNECNGNNINRNATTLLEAKLSKENYYYWIRKQYNELTDLDKKTITGSAMFVFLNKTCFRGIFREGPKGFNVPYGHYKNPEIVNKEHLTEIHDLIKDVIFTNCDFATSLNDTNDGDFIYLDPPYAPETDTSFVSYTKYGFNIDQHTKLFNLCNVLTDKNIKIIMSNSDVPLIKKYFLNDKYKINFITCKRTINSKNPNSKSSEVIIHNY